MNTLLSKKVESRFAFLAFFSSVFLFFTPFEQSGPNPSMFPKYFVAGAAIMLLAPLVAIRPMKLRMPSVLVLLGLAAILFHAIAMRPVPGQFMLLIAANFAMAILLYEASALWRKEFESALSWLLILNAIVISVQAGLFYMLGGGIFDFHKLIFGSDSRFVEDYLNIARFSGLQVEPGTYANYIACLLAILILSSEFRERILWLSLIALISIFLTNSGSSVYFVPVLIALLAYLGRKKIRPFHILILVLAIGIYLHFSGVIAHLQDRFFQHEDGSLSHRIEGIDAYMTATWDDKLFGLGFGSDPCVRCFYQDIGVTFNLLTRGGCIVALALSLLMFRALRVNGMVLSTILFLVPLNEKMSFYEAPIWLFILFAASGLRNSGARRAARTPAMPPFPQALQWPSWPRPGR
jgi:hypothetical protein